MSPLIDLRAYLKEVVAFVNLADDFVDKASSLRLQDIERTLRTQVNQGRAEVGWETPPERPITFRASTKYDGPGRTHAETKFLLRFACEFGRPRNGVKAGCTVWRLVKAVTHVAIERTDGRGVDCHFDYKNIGQWGPQVHFQVSEEPIGLPIPRIVASAFLPTDCADLMLSELHHLEWKELQHRAASKAHVSELRNGQENRTLRYLKDIQTQWRESREFTRFSMLQNYSSAVDALPAASDRPPKVHW